MTNPNQDSRSALVAGKHARPKADSPTATKTPSRATTDLAMQPSVAAAMVAIGCIAKPDSEIQLGDLIDTLDDSIGELQAGDMSRAEAMLFAQAHALQAMFVDLANRGTRSERMEHREANLRLALKAQNQCRMTLESLSNIKNPPVVIARVVVQVIPPAVCQADL